MKACNAILFLFLLIIVVLPAVAADDRGASWRDNGIVIAFHPEDLPQGKTGSARSFEDAQFAFSGQVPEIGDRGSIEFSGFVNSESRSGELLIGGEYSSLPQTISFTWDLGFSTPRITVETASSEISYPLVPVILPATSDFHVQPVIDLESLFPASHQEISAVLGSPDVRRILPKTLVHGIQVDRSFSGGSTELSPESRDFGEWSCGLSCGGAIGMGLFNVVSSGVLTPGAAAAAAYCGTCMGYNWGDHVTAQPPVNLPGDTSATTPWTSLLAPLPPGWMWVCTANDSGGYTCVPEEMNNSVIPYSF